MKYDVSSLTKKEALLYLIGLAYSCLFLGVLSFLITNLTILSLNPSGIVVTIDMSPEIFLIGLYSLYFQGILGGGVFVLFFSYMTNLKNRYGVVVRK